MNHPPIIPEVICSKCGSKNIVIPCNESSVKYRCLDCGHEKRHTPWDKIQANKYWANIKKKGNKIEF